MAAFMRMSRLLVGSTVFRTFPHKSTARNLSVIAGKYTKPASNQCAVAFSKVYSRNTATVSVSESLLQERGHGESRTDAHGAATVQGPPRMHPRDVTVETRINSIDNQARRTGRLDRRQVYAVLNHAENEGTITEQQALVILRSTGAVLAKDTAERRREVFNEVWAKLQKLVPVMNISHHNSVLRMRLENREKLNPAEVLAELEGTLKLFPNRITYQLLIAAYCEESDIAGASAILEHMKGQQIPVTEAVFHALIKGHMKRGDEEGAKQILTSMKEAGLMPIAETYMTFMCGYAEKGDLSGINQTLSEADRDEVTLQARHLFEVINTLVEHGHSSHLSGLLTEAAERFGNRPPFNHETLNCTYRLSAMGKDKEAMQVFQSITYKPDSSYTENIASNFLETQVGQKRPLSVVLSTMEDLHGSGHLPDPRLENIAFYAIREGHADMALDVYSMMKEKGEEVPRSSLQGLFKTRHSRGADPLCVLAVKMASLVSDPNICTDIHLHVVEPLSRKGMSVEDVFSKLKELGMEEKYITNLRTLHAIQSGQFTEAKRLISDHGLPSLALLSTLMSRGFHAGKDIPGLFEVLKCIRPGIVTNKLYNDICSVSLLRSITGKDISLEDSVQLINTFNKVKFTLSNDSMKDDVMKILRAKGMDEDKLTEVDKSLTREKPFATAQTELTEKNLEVLALQLEESPSSVPFNLRNRAEIILLKQYCRDGDIEKADKLKASLDNRGFQYRPDLLLALGSYYARYKKDMDSAQKYKALIKEERNVPARLLLSIATLHAETGQIDKAISELNESVNIEGKFKYELTNDADKLLTACSKEHSPQRVLEVAELLFDKGYVERGTASVLRVVMQAYVNKGEADDIVTALEGMVQKYNKCPAFSDILRYFIEREDADRLQKVVDLLSTVRGEMEVLHHLAFSFVECGKIRQAKRILETPGLRALVPILNDGCRRFYTYNKIECMQHMVDITKDLFGIVRDDMLFWLMRMYAKTDDYKKALDVLTRYEEEGVMPRHRTLRYLAKVLESQGMAVPFDVPEAKARPVEATVIAETHGVLAREILKHLEAEDIDKALELRASATEKGESLDPELLAEGAHLLFKQRKSATLRNLLTQLGDKADIDSLTHIRPRFSYRAATGASKMVNRTLFRAYINSERTEEFIDFIQGNINSLPAYLTTDNIQYFVETKPELFSKLESTIIKYTDGHENKWTPVNYLWNYYILNSKTQEADDLIKKYPDMVSGIQLKYLLNRASEANKEHVFATLLDLLKGSNSSYPVYGSWIKLKSTLGDVDGATSLYQQGLDAGMVLRNFGLWNLESYQTLLESKGLQVPWEVEDLEDLRRHVEDKRRPHVESDSELDASKRT